MLNINNGFRSAFNRIRGPKHRPTQEAKQLLRSLPTDPGAIRTRIKLEQYLDHAKKVKDSENSRLYKKIIAGEVKGKIKKAIHNLHKGFIKNMDTRPIMDKQFMEKVIGDIDSYNVNTLITKRK
ncbi:MAG: hypothetical protein MJA84_03595, partial [Firmicutes bacterium]|nr:hypothetical protein [Bacillota bacterium]